MVIKSLGFRKTPRPYFPSKCVKQSFINKNNFSFVSQLFDEIWHKVQSFNKELIRVGILTLFIDLQTRISLLLLGRVFEAWMEKYIHQEIHDWVSQPFVWEIVTPCFAESLNLSSAKEIHMNKPFHSTLFVS